MKKSTKGASTAVSASLVYFYTTKETSTTDVSQAGVTGFEPVFTVLETVALPLNYSPKSVVSIHNCDSGVNKDFRQEFKIFL